ncbi:MAG TPA: hypothetical protein VFN19_07040 [Candidatus Nanopelagicales bacterium]|jgi:EAL domain-containing protein (putative c-di-GMP-specific phosphodiesterase class I)|nr:hypothetical protein [Candidatus Nanopelagicales bacterium]
MTATTEDVRTPLLDTLARTRRTRSKVEELISDPARLAVTFRRIVSAEDHTEVLGWHAQPGGGPTDLASLLAEAGRLGLAERLDWALRCHTFDLAVAADLPGELHLSPDPSTFGTACPPRLAVPFLQGRRSLAVVAELTPAAFIDQRRTSAAIGQMREWGWQFAYPDLAGDPAQSSAQQLLATIRPAYVRLDVSRDTHSELPAAAVEVGAAVIATGVRTEADLARAQRAGARWLCGDLVGRDTALPR